MIPFVDLPLALDVLAAVVGIIMLVLGAFMLALLAVLAYHIGVRNLAYIISGIPKVIMAYRRATSQQNPLGRETQALAERAYNCPDCNLDDRAPGMKMLCEKHARQMKAIHAEYGHEARGPDGEDPFATTEDPEYDPTTGPHDQ